VAAPLIALLGVASRPGFRSELPTTNELYNWPCLVNIKIGGLNLCINKVVILEFVVVAITAILFLWAFGRPRIVPRGIQNLMEAIYDFIANDVVQGVLGKEGARWQPFLMVLFLFTFLISLLEVVPGVQFPVSSRIAVPIILAITSWVIYNYAGVRQKGFLGYFKSVMFPPDVPVFAYVLLTPIELATALVLRPATLALRLFANFFAGHVLLVVFFVGTAYLVTSPVTIAFGIGALALTVLLVALEIFIAAVQAYVFTLLTAVYITLSVSHEH
jgi:F-type H+-transporting ATPase subunit a